MKKYLIILSVAILSVGCSDLEENPVGILSPSSFFQSPSDLQAAANGSFAYMASERYWGRNISVPIQIRSDMFTTGDMTTTQDRIDFDQMKVNTNNSLIGYFWPQSYAIIGAANQVIEGAPLVKAPAAIVNPIAAQAHFSRAFAYYHLVRLFGEIPYIDYAVTDAKAVSTISKTSVPVVYENIIADLKYAKEWLPNVQPTRSLPSKATAASYLASVYLTLGQYQNAYNEAKYVIDNEGTFQLALEPNYQDLFNADKINNSKEPLFDIDFIGQQRVGYLGQDYNASHTGCRGDLQYGNGEGWSVMVPSLKVFKTWDYRDYRRAVSFDTIAKTKAVGGVEVRYENFIAGLKAPRAVNRPHVAKFTRFSGLSGLNGRESSNNYMMMRYAETLLIAAEALNEITPGTAEADGYVNRIRARARHGNGTTTSMYPENVQTGLSKDAFRTMVVEERRIELSFEGVRWYDIVRLKLGSQVFGPNGLDPQPNFDPARDYLFPLPITELQINPNLLPQNPGY